MKVGRQSYKCSARTEKNTLKIQNHSTQKKQRRFPYVSGSANRICLGVATSAAPCSIWGGASETVLPVDSCGTGEVGEGVEEGESEVGVEGRVGETFREPENPSRLGRTFGGD